MVVPAISIDTRTRKDAGNDSDIEGRARALIDRNQPVVFETAAFGPGWFWGIEPRFKIIDGLISIREQLLHEIHLLELVNGEKKLLEKQVAVNF